MVYTGELPEWLTEQSAKLSTGKTRNVGSSPTLSAIYNFSIEQVIIKKYQRFKGKTFIEILFQIGFRRQEKGLRMLYLINRKGISKIGVCVAKKKIKLSVERNFIKRRIRNAYNRHRKNIYFLQMNLFIFFFWCIKKIPSFKRIERLMKKNIIFLCKNFSYLDEYI